MNSNRNEGEGEEFELQPPAQNPQTGPAPQARLKSGPIPNLRPNLRPKSGAVPNFRPKTGPLQHIKPNDNTFEMQPLPESDPAAFALADGSDLTIAPVEETVGEAAHVVLEGPPPSDKVDFENLPEFVWQRKMLRTVRIIALVVTVIVVIIAVSFFMNAGKGAKDSLKEVINGEPPPEQTQP